MEWVEISGRTIEEAKLIALEKLGVVEEDAEFVILSEPKGGLFGWRRGEARIRARVKPIAPRPKYRRSNHKHESLRYRKQRSKNMKNIDNGIQSVHNVDERVVTFTEAPQTSSEIRKLGIKRDGEDMNDIDESTAEVDEAKITSDFLLGLTDRLGVHATVNTVISDEERQILAEISGTDLGVLIGHGGATLAAIEELTRTVIQRRVGHSSRINVDVAGYKAKRQAALQRLARDTAQQVIESGVEHILEPMLVADRKIIHDTISEIAGVATRSEGRDPKRRVVIYPSAD